MPAQNEIELRWIFAVIRRRWWIIAGCTLLATIVAYAATSWIPPVYEATSILLVKSATSSKGNDYNSLIAGEHLALTYSQMLEGQPLMDAVIAKLGLDGTDDSLREKITADPIPNTQLIRLTVKSTSRNQAALLANTIPETFIERVTSMEAERYKDSLSSAQDEIDTLSAKINENQAKIDNLNAQKIMYDDEFARQQNQLSEYRSDYRAIHQSYQSLQLSIIQLTDRVKVIEKAHNPEASPFSPPTATSLLLIDQSLITGDRANPGNTNSDLLALTYGPILKGQTVLQEAITQLGLNQDPDRLAQRVSVNSVNFTQLIELTVQDTDPSMAVSLADAIAAAFIKQIRAQLTEPYADQLSNLQAQMDGLSLQITHIQNDLEAKTAQQIQVETELARLESQQNEDRSNYQAMQTDYKQLELTAAQAANSVEIAETAQVPKNPVQNELLYTSIAAFIGLIVGVGSSFLLEQLEDRIRDKQDVRTILGMNPLGNIGHLTSRDKQLFSGSLFSTEDFRILATSLWPACLRNNIRTILVTSPASSDGKTTVVANLAVALAKTGLRIILVDADLHYHRLYQVFNANQGEGLVSALQTGNIEDVLEPTGVEGLRLLPTKDGPRIGPDLFNSTNLNGLLGKLSSQADLVLIDCSPILATADAILMASLTNGTLLVVRAGQTGTQDAQNAADRLRQTGSNLIGIILNDVGGRKGNYGYYQYEPEENGNGTARVQKRSWPLAAIERFINNRKNKVDINGTALDPKRSWPLNTLEQFINNRKNKANS
jgi:capsular exopolysaccharide synthesis family protein